MAGARACRTLVAILTSPAAFVWFHKHQGWSIGWSLAATIATVAAFRGFIDLVLRRFIPWPSLFGTDDTRLQDEDVVNRRRAPWLLGRPAGDLHRPRPGFRWRGRNRFHRDP